MPEDKLGLLSEWVSGMPYHIGIQVPDLDEALRFCRDLLGFEEVWRLTFGGELIESLSGVPGASVETVQLLCPGGSRVELQQYDPQGSVGQARLNNQGLNHLSFGVTDVRAAYEALKAAGVEFASEPIDIEGAGSPVDGWSVAYFSDPRGTTLELLNPIDSSNYDSGGTRSTAGWPARRARRPNGPQQRRSSMLVASELGALGPSRSGRRSW